MDTGILVTSILAFLSSLLILGIIIVQFRPKQTILFNSIFYVIIVVSTVYLTIMFRETASLIRYDILNTVANTSRYVYVIDIWIVMSVSTIGVVVGYVIVEITNYVKRKNYESIWYKKD
ncbi:membrane protein [Staphylococcus phage vB_SauM_JDF86]|nr:membrane protein [Staphylococcus phage vB_SauM_JDF86]